MSQGILKAPRFVRVEVFSGPMRAACAEYIAAQLEGNEIRGRLLLLKRLSVQEDAIQFDHDYGAGAVITVAEGEWDGGTDLGSGSCREKAEALFKEFCADQFAFRLAHHDASETSVGTFVKRIRQEGIYRKLWLAKGQMFGGPEEASRFSEVHLREGDDWKDNNIAKYLLREYENEPVLRAVQNPYDGDTIIVTVRDREDLNAEARRKCLAEC